MNSSPIITSEVCGRCKFARVTPLIQGGKLCKRYPPQLTSFLMGRDNAGKPIVQHFPAWPPVADEEGACGEFKPRIEIPL